MTGNYYSVRDVVADEFGDLIFARNDEVACRLFSRMLKSNPHINPDDLELYCVGVFDFVTGTFVCNAPLRKVVIGDDTSDVDSLS